LGTFFVQLVFYHPEQLGDKMKTFKAICAASVIAFSLSIPAYADAPPPGDIHVPGSPNPVTGGMPTPTTEPGDTGLAGGATAADGDISFSALADMLWTLASIF
jgi:hypothetical protein